MTPINPATELTRINAAAIPDITFISAHRNSNNRGLRKIPPPTPVRPDRKPSPAPAVNNTARCGRALIEAGALRAQTKDRHAEYNSTAPTTGWETWPGKVIAPPTSASGAAVRAKGQNNRHEHAPIRTQARKNT